MKNLMLIACLIAMLSVNASAAELLKMDDPSADDMRNIELLKMDDPSADDMRNIACLKMDDPSAEDMKVN